MGTYTTLLIHFVTIQAKYI